MGEEDEIALLKGAVLLSSRFQFSHPNSETIKLKVEKSVEVCVNILCVIVVLIHNIMHSTLIHIYGSFLLY